MECRKARRPAVECRDLLVAYSPHAGARSAESRTRSIAADLASAGYRVQTSADLTAIAGLAAEWNESGHLRAVLACGGDGTAAAVRNCTPLNVPLLVIPMGTENLLGRYVSQSSMPQAVRETVEQGVTIGLDLGLARSDKSGSRHFLMMVSAGFDAEVVRRLHERRGGHITLVSYVQPTLQTIRSYEYPEIQLYCHDDPSRWADMDRCRWLFAFNLPLYARSWQLAPDAVGTDGLLDVCAFSHGSLRHVMRYIWHVLRGTHLQLADTRLVRARKMRIEAVNAADLAYQLDGDFGGWLPVEIEVLPAMLRLLVMPSVAERLGFSHHDEA